MNSQQYKSSQEADIKTPSWNIDGIKIVSVENTTITPNAHIIAFYKGQKILIPIYK